ncbi:Uncharacterized membrane protein YesL [Oceanobacillus limi]|uniref:Uncharacterized membrane protein YesL n=1 Tax=Oceanobacillus limi TaxID=930131 RepID=A0A1I0B0R4_9BACI|nr:DUF624 domain-containing protein [Oceanobacillus limi]SET00403.1 Uncharacterized membrane protein YesL [Oceanobacillus limi]
MNYSGFMGGLFSLAEWIMRFTVVNILWIISNLPIFIIVFVMFLTPSNLANVILAIPIAILFPILFFPSLAAAYATVRDWIINKEKVSLLGAFWTYGKENYKTSFQSGLLVTGLWIIWAVDFYYFYQQNNFLGFIMLIIGVGLFVFMTNFICLSVHYHMTKKELFRNAFLITVGNPLLFISIIIIHASVIYMSMRIWFLFPFFSLSVTAFLTFYAFYRFTLKMEARAMKVTKR